MDKDEADRIEDENILFQEIREDYELPDYTKSRYRKFVVECNNRGLELEDYQGRGFYSGPAVRVESSAQIQKVIRATTMELQWDNMGLEYIVYPR